MRYPLFLIDAFITERPFSGNPAAVVLLEGSAATDWMQGVAREMNQAETAFVWPDRDRFFIRWFTPTVEVDLCGHATLAAAAALFEAGKWDGTLPVHFGTNTAGSLYVARIDESFELDFPSEPPQPDHHLALDILFPERTFVGSNLRVWMVELPREELVRRFEPDFEVLRSVGRVGVVITAAGSGESEVVSRFFAPGAGVDEDSVTGSAHCALAPHWTARLGKDSFRAEQASPRGGYLDILVGLERVRLRGKVRVVVRGTLEV